MARRVLLGQTLVFRVQGKVTTLQQGSLVDRFTCLVESQASVDGIRIETLEKTFQIRVGHPWHSRRCLIW